MGLLGDPVNALCGLGVDIFNLRGYTLTPSADINRFPFDTSASLRTNPYPDERRRTKTLRDKQWYTALTAPQPDLPERNSQIRTARAHTIRRMRTCI